MSRNRAQQRATRKRMEETGENYTTARTALLTGPLYLLVISTRHGESYELHASEKSAKDSALDFVETYWEQDGPGGEMPEDPDELLTAYFDADSMEESYSIQELAVAGAPPAPAPQPVDLTKVDLSGLDRDELLKLVRRVNDEWDSRNESSFLDVLKQALVDNEDVQQDVALHGPVVKVAFDTMDWDNGWFFNETHPSVTFEDGTRENEYELDGRELSSLMANVSSTYQPLGSTATYVVDLRTGETDQDDYGDNGLPGREAMTPGPSRVVPVGKRFRWECTECVERSGLQWDTVEEAGRMLVRHIEAHGGGAAAEEEAPPRPPRTAFYVDEVMKTPNGYIPSLVTEGEPGHSPMIGSGELSEPWYWGTDIDTARRIAAKANADKGLTPEDVDEIITSSITASIREQGKHDAAQERLEQLRRGY